MKKTTFSGSWEQVAQDIAALDRNTIVDVHFTCEAVPITRGIFDPHHVHETAGGRYIAVVTQRETDVLARVLSLLTAPDNELSEGERIFVKELREFSMKCAAEIPNEPWVPPHKREPDEQK